jgi:hypothetical protein
MSMVVSMEWVAKKKGAVLAVALPLLILFSIFTGEVLGDESAFIPAMTPLTCFESATATLRVTQESTCPGSLVSLGSTSLSQILGDGGEVVQIHPLLQERFNAAHSAALLEGVQLEITSGFRSKQRQGELFVREVKIRGSESEAAKWVLPPAYSHHPLGLAIDVNYPGDRPGALWLEKNGSRFGLCRVYANEWWHFEGVIAPGQTCPPMAANALVDIP